VDSNFNILPLCKEGFFYKYIKESKQKMNSNNFKDILEAYSKIYTEQEIEELYKGKHGQSDTEYQDGRSDAGKRISGDSSTGPRYYTLGRARGTKPDAPTAPGAKPVNTPKLSSDERTYHQYNKSGAKNRAQYNKVGGPKGLPEEIDIYDLVLEYLCVEGYAETLEEAEWIMANQLTSEDVEEILEAHKPLPTQKMQNRRYYVNMKTGEAAGSSRNERIRGVLDAYKKDPEGEAEKAKAKSKYKG